MRETAEIYGFEPDRRGFILCPFHGEKTASLKLYSDNYYCFGCGEHGDAVDFLSKLKSISPIEAAKELAEKVGITHTKTRKSPRAVHTGAELLRFYDEWEKKAFLTLNNYHKLLLRFREKLKPSSENEPLHPLFVKALQEEEYIHSLCMIFITGSPKERKRFYIDYREAVNDYEVQYRKYTGT